MVIDGKGNITSKNENSNNKQILTNNPNDNLLLERGGQKDKKSERNFKPINTYVPSGNLVYNQDMFRKLNERINK